MSNTSLPDAINKMPKNFASVWLTTNVKIICFGKTRVLRQPLKDTKSFFKAHQCISPLSFNTLIAVETLMV